MVVVAELVAHNIMTRNLDDYFVCALCQLTH